jgi:hypothetical protein
MAIERVNSLWLAHTGFCDFLQVYFLQDGALNVLLVPYYKEKLLELMNI